MLGGAVDLLHGVLAESDGQGVDSQDGAGVLGDVAPALLAEATRDLALGRDKVADVGLAVEGHVLRLESRGAHERSATAASAQGAVAVEGHLCVNEFGSQSYPMHRQSTESSSVT